MVRSDRLKLIEMEPRQEMLAPGPPDYLCFAFPGTKWWCEHSWRSLLANYLPFRGTATGWELQDFLLAALKSQPVSVLKHKWHCPVPWHLGVSHEHSGRGRLLPEHVVYLQGGTAQNQSLSTSFTCFSECTPNSKCSFQSSPEFSKTRAFKRQLPEWAV